MEIKFISNEQFIKKKKNGYVKLNNEWNIGKISDVKLIDDVNIEITLKNENIGISNGKILYFAFINLRDLIKEHKIKNLLISAEFINNIKELKRKIIINTFKTVFENKDINIFFEDFRK